MIVDDEDHIRNLLVKSIRETFPEAEVSAVAGNGREALELALLQPPDIVITDISMPFMNGLELISELQKHGINSKNAVISGYDEFDYARQAISLGVKDYLLKPFLPRELRDVIQKMMQELDSQRLLQQNMKMLHEQAKSHAGLAREKAVKDLLRGDERAVDGAGLNGNLFAAGIIRLPDSIWDFSSQKGIEDFLQLIGEGYFPSGISTYAVSFDGIQLVMVWGGNMDKTEIFTGKIRLGVEKIQASLQKYYKIELLCAIGRPCRSLKELAGSYQEAMAVWRGTLDQDNPVLLYGTEDKEQPEVNAGSRIRDLKNQIRLLLRTGSQEDVLRQLQQLMKCYASLANKKNDYISVSVRELVYGIQSDMENAGYEWEDKAYISDLQNRLDYISLYEMKILLEVYIKKCCTIIQEHSEETKASTAVLQIRLLIDGNIKDPDLSLEWIADQVHFSVSYVRQIFKQQTGQNFGEYLIRKRMELAGMLLQKTSLRIQEIAAECGYDNQRYFASSFKKYYECTPTEFKQAVEQERLY